MELELAARLSQSFMKACDVPVGTGNVQWFVETCSAFTAVYEPGLKIPVYSRCMS